MRKLHVLLKILIFLALVGLCLLLAAGLTLRKESVRKYADMGKVRNADVLLLGSSHVINDINPAQLYGEYGIAAYNLGGHGSILPATYYELLCALDEFSPQLVVVDCYMMERDYHFVDEMTPDFTDENRQTSVSQLHLNLDAFRLSRNKYYAVRDLIADPMTRWEFLVPFSLYHNRWSVLEEDDFMAGQSSPLANRLLGAEIRTRVSWQIAPHTMGDEEDDTAHLGEQYLQMLLNLCRERGINVVLTFLPCNSTAADRQSARRMEAVAAAAGVPCLNFLPEDVVDVRTDYNDEGHLNLLGMSKVTGRLGAFLSEHTELPDRRGDDGWKLWQERYDEYEQMLDAMPANADMLPEALLALMTDRTKHSAALYIPGTGAAAGDPAVLHLADTLLPDNGLRDCLAAGEPWLLLLPKEGAPTEIAGYQTTGWEDTPLGSAEIIQVENFTGLYLNEDESDNLLDMEEDRLADAQLILDPEDVDIRKRLIFNYAPLYASPEE